jgi:hypothetical protein
MDSLLYRLASRTSALSPLAGRDERRGIRNGRLELVYHAGHKRLETVIGTLSVWVFESKRLERFAATVGEVVDARLE